MLRLGILLLGGSIAATGLAFAGAGFAVLSLAASGAASSLGALVSCAPTPPLEEETEQDPKQQSESTT